MSKVWKEVRSWVGTIALAFVLTLLIGVFVIQPTKVMGHSMDPTLHDGQRLYVSKLSHTFNYEPAYGDIVIIDSRVDRKRTLLDDLMDHPMFHLFDSAKNDEHIVYVKRVIGKPGDVLTFKDGHVYRNDQELDEPYVAEAMLYTSAQPIVVPEKHIFVMGDNRNHSQDSRQIGFVPLNHVLGIKM